MLSISLAIRQKFSEYLATSNDDDKFPTSREKLVEEFMRIKSVKNIVGDKDTGNMTNNVTKSNGSKDAPEILTFEDGTHGIKIKDGSYQVFVMDKKGVPTNVKPLTLQRKGNRKRSSVQEGENSS